MKRKYGLSFIIDYIIILIGSIYYFSILLKYNSSINNNRNILIPILFFIGLIFILTLAIMTGKVISDLILFNDETDNQVEIDKDIQEKFNQLL